MRVRLSEKAARRLRAELSELGLCDAGVGDALDTLVRDGGADLTAAVDAILLGEGFGEPDLVDRRLWRRIRDAVAAAVRDSEA